VDEAARVESIELSAAELDLEVVAAAA